MKRGLKEDYYWAILSRGLFYASMKRGLKVHTHFLFLSIHVLSLNEKRIERLGSPSATVCVPGFASMKRGLKAGSHFEFEMNLNLSLNEKRIESQDGDFFWSYIKLGLNEKRIERHLLNSPPVYTSSPSLNEKRIESPFHSTLIDGLG